MRDFVQAVGDESKDAQLEKYNGSVASVIIAVIIAFFLIDGPHYTAAWEDYQGFAIFWLGVLGTFLGLTMLLCIQIDMLTPQGRSAAIQLLGLKKYLRDFSDFSSRGVSDVKIWGQYLVYATAFGMCERVSCQLPFYSYWYDGKLSGDDENDGD